MLKTHTCGELRAEHAGHQVTLAGWVNRRRDMGGVIFIDLRDREGLVQVVFDPDREKMFELAERIRDVAGRGQYRAFVDSAPVLSSQN